MGGVLDPPVLEDHPSHSPPLLRSLSRLEGLRKSRKRRRRRLSATRPLSFVWVFVWIVWVMGSVSYRGGVHAEKSFDSYADMFESAMGDADLDGRPAVRQTQLQQRATGGSKIARGEDVIPVAGGWDSSASSSSSSSRGGRRRRGDFDDVDDLDEENFGATRSTGEEPPLSPPPPTQQQQFDDEYRPPPKPSGVRRPQSFGGEPELVIHLIPHSHVYHGFLRDVDGYEKMAFEILNGVVNQLEADPKRRFVWSEIWFFRKWYETSASSRTQDAVRRLVREGQLEFVGGGVYQDLEEMSASAHVLIGQLQEGMNWLDAVFGVVPKIGWQLGPVSGHSESTVEILSKMGFEALFINRVHFRTRQRFRHGQHLQFIWRVPKSSSSLAGSTSTQNPTTLPAGGTSEIFTHLLSSHYSSPAGFDFEKSGVRQVTNPSGRASRLVSYAREESRYYRTHHIPILLGDDFDFRMAEKQFSNMDKIITEAANAFPEVQIRYSTAEEYLMALRRASATANPPLRFPLFTGDFQPLADTNDGHWSGVYSSRSSLRRLARILEARVGNCEFLFGLARARVAALGPVAKVAGVEEDGRVTSEQETASFAFTSHVWKTFEFARRQSSLVSNVAVSGFHRGNVVKDFQRRAKIANEIVTRLMSESVSFLAFKKRSRFTSAGPHVRPKLRHHPLSTLEIALGDGLASASTKLGNFPIILVNSDLAPKTEIVSVKLSANWNAARRIKVTDARGSLLPSQVHKTIVPGLGTDGHNSNANANWATETRLFFKAEIPALGFSTFFVSIATAAERLLDSAPASSSSSSSGSSNVAVQLQVWDILDGRIASSSLLHANNKDVNLESPTGSQSSSGNSAMLEGVKVMSQMPKPEKGGSCLAVENERYLVDSDCTSFLIKSVLEKRGQKRTMAKQQFRVHESLRGGAGLFRPDRLESVPLTIGERGRVTVGLVRGPLVQELHVMADGVTQILRLYRMGGDRFESFAHLSVSLAPSSPNVDTVVRFTTDLKTRGSFLTDTPLGGMRQRRVLADTNLAATMYPCASTLSLRDLESKPALALSFLTSQSMACTGAASAASGNAEYGVAELMLHRTHVFDDGRGLGEGMEDNSVAHHEILLTFEPFESFLSKKWWLVKRAQNSVLNSDAIIGDGPHQLFPRDAWLSRFNGEFSLLESPEANVNPNWKSLSNTVKNSMRIAEFSPKSETEDDFFVRFEVAPLLPNSASSFTFDFASLVGGSGEAEIIAMRDLGYACLSSPVDQGASTSSSSSSSNGVGDSLKFVSSGKEDDFVAAGGAVTEVNSFGGSGSESPSSPFALSEFVQNEPPFSKTSSSSSSFGFDSLATHKGRGNAGDEGGGARGLSNIRVAATANGSPNPPGELVEVKRGEARCYSMTLNFKSEEGKEEDTTTSNANSNAMTRRERNTNRHEAVIPPPPPPPSEEEEKSSSSFDSSYANTKPHHATNTDAHHNRRELEEALKEEERLMKLLESRVIRLNQNVEDMRRELNLLEELGHRGNGALDRKTAEVELERGEQQLSEGNRLLDEARSKIETLKSELRELGPSHPTSHARGANSYTSDSSNEGRRRYLTREGGGSGSSATIQGMLTGAAGMLIFIIALQWITGHRNNNNNNMHARRNHHQAFVPVRYVATAPPQFSIPSKRL